MKRPIFAFIGPSGCGKSTVIDALVQRFPDEIAVVKSVTTRPLTRGPEDHRNYDRVEREEFERMIADDELIQYVEYPSEGKDEYYGNHRATTDAVLERRFGITALVEQGVENFRRDGYEVFAITIAPIGGDRSREGRKAADDARARSGFVPDATIENRFDRQDGLQMCVDSLATMLSAFMQGWAERET